MLSTSLYHVALDVQNLISFRFKPVDNQHCFFHAFKMFYHAVAARQGERRAVIFFDETKVSFAGNV